MRRSCTFKCEKVARPNSASLLGCQDSLGHRGSYAAHLTGGEIALNPFARGLVPVAKAMGSVIDPNVELAFEGRRTHEVVPRQTPASVICSSASRDREGRSGPVLPRVPARGLPQDCVPIL